MWIYAGKCDLKNIKLVILSLVMAFIGVPILAHCVALFSGLFVAIIAYVLDGPGLAKETDGLPSALMLLAVCNLMFFGGRIWSRDNAPEDNLIRRQVGGPDAAIEPWQRPEDSGSQTVMLAKVMKGTPMLKPREMKVADQMGELLDVVAQYQDTPGAIGYTFRYYATRMHAREGVKLLAINGIAPTAENIRNDVYPWVAGVYMVTQENPTTETQKVVEWFLSPQGQSLVQDVGYVPMYETLIDIKQHHQ